MEMQTNGTTSFLRRWPHRVGGALTALLLAAVPVLAFSDLGTRHDPLPAGGDAAPAVLALDGPTARLEKIRADEKESTVAVVSREAPAGEAAVAVDDWDETSKVIWVQRSGTRCAHHHHHGHRGHHHGSEDD